MLIRRRRSLVFYHIPKTGGTSVTGALRPLFDEAVTSDGNISAACLTSRTPNDSTLFHGHPEHGAALAVPRNAVTATLLRAPDEQAISNYLHLRRNPQLPLHGMAVQYGLSGLMRAVPLLLAFQAVSLDVAISMEQLGTPDDLFSRLPAIWAFLDRIDVVGRLDQLDMFLNSVARRSGRRAAALPATPHLNTAREFGTEQKEVDELRKEYRALASIPVLRDLMALEAALVRRAHAHWSARLPHWLRPFRSRALVD